jgi:fructose-1,6-bisphosphatase/inositol monophosphatase family enzyme
MIPSNQLINFAKNLRRKANTNILSLCTRSPERAFKRRTEPGKDPNNQPLFIDEYAETLCEEALLAEFEKKIKPIGEESFQLYPELRDLTYRKEVVALMDVVDGTDLLLRGLYNWCSAIVFFYPPEKRILAAIVADHIGNIFYSAEGDASAFFLGRRSREPAALSVFNRPSSLEEGVIRFVRHKPSGPLDTRKLCDASICFYGQKPPAFLSAVRPGLTQQMQELADKLEDKEQPAPALRIYNLGGIPMMVKVANGTLNSVFDLTGPKPHDMVAGAYIALKAGAFVGDVQGNAIKETDLAHALLKPDNGGPAYILASTADLYHELRSVLIPT